MTTLSASPAPTDKSDFFKAPQERMAPRYSARATPAPTQA